MRPELHPEALARFHEIQKELRAVSHRRARAFAAEVRNVTDMLAMFPRAGAPIGSARRVTLRTFPYSLLYVIDGNVVRITTIEPQKREPDYWADEDDS